MSTCCSISNNTYNYNLLLIRETLHLEGLYKFFFLKKTVIGLLLEIVFIFLIPKYAHVFSLNYLYLTARIIFYTFYTT